ncbi:MAG: ankyrin repeat domain-containing protein, partial [Candidatus Berkiella sp.]
MNNGTSSSEEEISGNRSNMGVHSFSTLHQAAAAGDIKAIHALVTSGADINAWDPWGEQKTPLIYAIEARQVKAVKTLISMGADTNLVGNDDQNQLHSPMFFALSKIIDLPPSHSFTGQVGVIEHYYKVYTSNNEYREIAYDLYKSGASLIDVVDKNCTPIMVAAIEKNDVITVESLLSPYIWNSLDKFEVYSKL